MSKVSVVLVERHMNDCGVAVRRLTRNEGCSGCAGALDPDSNSISFRTASKDWRRCF
jgi:hypothetical protein